ncbi:DUF2513 domain-containing protein [Pseudoroseomonas sp. WGS1072]|uniref:DUF2513 domain-containing protein n=1 Tax=Roseomonas sp. WGS1072 TaxID=3366816 RepID=UPI003BEFDFE9
MKRDMDLVRDILLKVEGSGAYCDLMQEMLPQDSNGSYPQELFEKHLYHAMLLEQAGFIKGSADSSGYMIEGITWQGHEFLDAIRDPEMWRKTKAGAKEIGSAGVGILWEIAKGYAKQMAKDKLGLPI